MTHVAAPMILLVAVTALSALARRLRVPAPVLLAVGGLVLGLVPAVPTVHPDPAVIQTLVLPPLLYAAAVEQPTRQVRADWRAIGALAVGLVLATTAIVGLVAHALRPEVPIAATITLGAILSSTDPVAVSALARRLPLPRRLLTILQAESLLNDATSLVVYRVAVGVAVAGASLDLLDAGGRLLLVAGGGALVGVLVAWVEMLLRNRLDDPLLDSALSLLTPFAAYLAGEAAHVSGITAVVICGLYLSPRTPRLSWAGRLQTQAIWQMVVFVLEGVVFTLIGLQLPRLVRDLPASTRGSTLLLVAVLTGTLMAVRFAWVYALVYLPRLVSGRVRRERPADWQLPAILAWTGTRGVVALAAALSLPLLAAGGQPFPARTLMLVVTSAVILATLLLQGLTLAPLAARLGVRADLAAERAEELLARHRSAGAALARLEELVDVQAAPPAVAEWLRRDLEEQLERSTPAGADPEPGGGPDGRLAAAEADLRRYLIQAQRAELVRLRDSGVIGDPALRRVQRTLDLQESILDSTEP
jgi:CPA1 family monovalent cation:H+ antiporter